MKVRVLQIINRHFIDETFDESKKEMYHYETLRGTIQEQHYTLSVMKKTIILRLEPGWYLCMVGLRMTRHLGWQQNTTRRPHSTMR